MFLKTLILIWLEVCIHEWLILERPWSLIKLTICLTTAEAVLITAYTNALQDQEKLLKQKSYIQWLKTSDRNNAFFHRVVNVKINRNSISSLENDDRVVVSDRKGISELAVNYYVDLLGTSNHLFEKYDLRPFIAKPIPPNFVLKLAEPISMEEIKSACWSMALEKAPSLDGYNNPFFKKAWLVSGEEVSKAILEFFDTGSLMREINSTYPALIPKCQSPPHMKEFRPISCCNLLYKIIAEVLANRLKPLMPSIISNN